MWGISVTVNKTSVVEMLAGNESRTESMAPNSQPVHNAGAFVIVAEGTVGTVKSVGNSLVNGLSDSVMAQTPFTSPDQSAREKVATRCQGTAPGMAEVRRDRLQSQMNATMKKMKVLVNDRMGHTSHHALFGKGLTKMSEAKLAPRRDEKRIRGVMGASAIIFAYVSCQ
jgi:hypothetical protein